MTRNERDARPTTERELYYQTAQLRHAYYHLVNGHVGDPAELARGLISPAIRFLERLARDSGRHAEREDPERSGGAEAEGCQSGDAVSGASPNPSRPSPTNVKEKE